MAFQEEKENTMCSKKCKFRWRLRERYESHNRRL